MALMQRHSRLYDWGDGRGAVHSIPLSQHQKNMGGGAAAPAAPAAPGEPAPAQPAAVAPFFTATDLDAINDFNTRYATELTNIDFELGNLGADTSYQKTGNDKTAKGNSAEASDQMAGRGLFKSSIKDAALYDIEASRSLANKFLDDKLTAATLNAGTSKKILADSKQRFDTAMLAHQTENAAGVNQGLQSGWADAMAAWTQAHPAPAPVAAAPAAPPRATGGTAQPTTARPNGPTNLGRGNLMLNAAAAQRYDWGDGKGPVHSIPLSQHQQNARKK